MQGGDDSTANEEEQLRQNRNNENDGDESSEFDDGRNLQKLVDDSHVNFEDPRFLENSS